MLTLWVLGKMKPKTKGHLSRYAIRIHRDVFVSDLSQIATQTLHDLLIRLEGDARQIQTFPYRRSKGLLPKDSTRHAECLKISDRRREKVSWKD